MLLFYIAVYDYLIAASRSEMFALLLIIQFSEIKSAVLKEMKEEKLRIMCQDGMVFVWCGV